MLLSTTPTYYDRTKPVIVQTDASEYGLGATSSKVVGSLPFPAKPWPMWRLTMQTSKENVCQCASASRSSTPISMAGTSSSRMTTRHWRWSQHKAIHATPPLLQQMLLCMQKYDYTIQYKPGKEIILANHLSHFPFCKDSLPIAINQNIQHVQLSNKLDAIRGAVECNPVYNTLYCLTLRGWPNCLKSVLRIAHYF